MSSPATDDVTAAVLAAEAALLDPAVRMQPAEVAARLAPEFREIGASGRLWGYADTIELLEHPEASHGLHAARIAEPVAVALAPGLTLLTYVLEAPGRRSRRSSIWREDAGALRLVFHQGTPLP